MTNRHAPLTPQMWMIDLFSARAASRGGVIRRCIRDIERYVSRDEFDQESFSFKENGRVF